MIVTDPFLTMGPEHRRESREISRANGHDYHSEIIDSNEINSFAIAGGFIHVDMGLLNFVSSDDELASVMGHEMGHVERRHVVTLNQKGNLLSILVGVLSILSPIGYFLGGYGGDLAYYKFSRLDELQADQYGLLLMSRAGYDPQSTADVLSKLGSLEGSANTDKYFEDHPPRIASRTSSPSRTQSDQYGPTHAQAPHDSDEGAPYSLVNNRVLVSALADTLAAGANRRRVALKREGRARAGSAHLVAAHRKPGDPATSSAASNLAAAMTINATNMRWRRIEPILPDTRSRISSSSMRFPVGAESR